MLLVGVKNQPIIKTILRSPKCVGEDKLVVTLKATLHSITKHRMPNWQLLFYIGCLLNIFSIAIPTEKVSACNAATHDCLLQSHCEKIADVLFQIETHDTLQFRVPQFQNRNRCHNP